MLRSSDEGPVVWAYLPEDQQRRLVDFLALFAPDVPMDDLVALVDAWWAEPPGLGRDIQGQFVPTRGGPVPFNLSVDAAATTLGLRLLPGAVGDWRAVAGQHVVELDVPKAAVEHEGMRLSIDAGDRVAAPMGAVTRDQSLAHAQTTLAARTGWAVHEPRLLYLEQCGDGVGPALL